jgi:hypothetical protein
LITIKRVSLAPHGENHAMAARKVIQHQAPERPELDALVATARGAGITDAQLQKQRVSFAYGNAPLSDDKVSKEAVQLASTRNRLAVA